MATDFDQVMNGSVYDEPYDVKIGFSVKGGKMKRSKRNPKHILAFFSGMHDLSDIVDNDQTVKEDFGNANQLFDCYVNAMPEKGVKKVRTEEEILIGLTKIKKAFKF